jgi:hypothetical protein
MRAGQHKYLHVSLTKPFKAVVRTAVLNGRPTAHTLSIIAGFTHPCNFSATLNAAHFPASPLTVRRLQRIAEHLQYDGPIFVKPQEEEEAQR